MTDTLNEKEKNALFNALYKILETQGVQLVGWIFAGAVLYGIYVQMPILMLQIERGHKEVNTQFTISQEKFARDVLEATKIRSEDLRTTLEVFRADEQEDRRLLVEMLRRTSMTAEELSEAIERAQQNQNAPPAPKPPPPD